MYNLSNLVVERVDTKPFGEGGRRFGTVLQQQGAMCLVQYKNESNTNSFIEIHEEELVAV